MQLNACKVYTLWGGMLAGDACHVIRPNWRKLGSKSGWGEARPIGPIEVYAYSVKTWGGGLKLSCLIQVYAYICPTEGTAVE